MSKVGRLKKLRAEWEELDAEHREGIYRWLCDHAEFIREQQESYIKRAQHDPVLAKAFVSRLRACQIALELLGDKKKDRKPTKFWRLR